MADIKDIDAVRAFIKDVKKKHARGNAKELTYRSELERLISDLGDSKIDPINEAKGNDGNDVDLTIERNGIAIGHLEAKKIGLDINKDNLKGTDKDQFDRYIIAFDNLIYTNHLDWDFYRNKNLVHSVSIAKIESGEIKPIKENLIDLVVYIQDFLNQRPQSIKKAKQLTKYMAIKTRVMGKAFEKGVEGDSALESLIEQRKWIDEVLVKDITAEKFADMYAQTITYGLFMAKLYSENNINPPKAFIRQNIPNLLPTNYPFLKAFFNFIATSTLGDVLDGYIDDLIEIYQAVNIKKIMATYGQGNGREDPFIDFYEAFLKEYNPLERKLSGSYYTPVSIVDFIVQAVDWVLKDRFNLPKGLAHSEKIKVQWKVDRKEGEKYKTKPENVHKVQILDPATGTGTFLAQVIRHIAKEENAPESGNWDAYVDKDLLPRLHGFESMMAPYAMAYLKLDMVLAELGYKPTKAQPDRMSIYLTNSLTDANKSIPPLPFTKWLEKEAHGATDIKDNYPIMCVIGNPPYNTKSKNNDDWIKELIKDYRKEPGGHAPLKEQKDVLYDDYVKFIRMAQHMVDKNGEGVVGMITNHSYLDNATFRGMRWHLMNSFDEIYILDLHGDNIKKTGENVFTGIQQGVSIIIAWKQKRAEGTDKPLAQVFRGDLLSGTREEKFNKLEAKGKALSKERLDKGMFKKIDPRAPDYFFKRVNYELKSEYNKGFKITELMDNNSVGIITRRDKVTIDIDEICLWNRVKDIAKMPLEELIKKYDISKDTDHWKLSSAKSDVRKNYDENLLEKILYRPFDERWIYYTKKSNGFISRPLRNIMNHFLEQDNLGLLLKRQSKHDFSYAFVTNKITEGCVFESSFANNTVLPLHLHPNGKSIDTTHVNMDKKIRKAIEDAATDSKNGKPNEYAIFDYIYGVLHAPDYRERYAEFLKTDFPYIPYPKTPAEFWYLSSIGTKLRDLHLMDPTKVKFDLKAYPFKGKGDCKVVAPHFDNKRAFINKTQYFDNVPESAWNFYIGGRQTAREWLTDPNRKVLETQDIEHYQRIIAVLVQTEQTMQTIKWNRP